MKLGFEVGTHAEVANPMRKVAIVSAASRQEEKMLDNEVELMAKKAASLN